MIGTGFSDWSDSESAPEVSMFIYDLHVLNVEAQPQVCLPSTLLHIFAL